MNKLRFSVTINVYFKKIIENWVLQKLWMMHNPIIKRLLYLLIDFWILFSLLFQWLWYSSGFIAFSLDLSAPTCWSAVFFFIPNMLVKTHSDFLALRFLTGVYVMGYMELLSVNPSGVETISASIISLNICWSSHLTAFLYNFLVFWRHLCSYRALLLNYWSIPMVFTWYLKHGYCNIPLSTTRWCSNVSIQRTESITLVIIFYLIHLSAWAVLPSSWKHIYSSPTGVNIVVLFKFNVLTYVVVIQCAWLFEVEMVGMLQLFSFYITRLYVIIIFHA